LASNGWWKHFWHLCSKFNVDLTLSWKFHFALPVDDRTFMDIVTSTNIYPVDWELAGQQSLKRPRVRFRPRVRSRPKGC
jgi:hypothetical protein